MFPSSCFFSPHWVIIIYKQHCMYKDRQIDRQAGISDHAANGWNQVNGWAGRLEGMQTKSYVEALEMVMFYVK